MIPRSATRLPAKVAIMAVLFACVTLSGAASSFAASADQAPPLAPDQARVWFLRELNPGTAMHAPMIYANGAPLAISAEGTAFYRDFEPGTYAFSVENCSPASNRGLTVPLDAGNQFAFQIQAEEFGPLDCPNTFFLQVPAAEALSDIFAPLAYLGQR